MSEDVVRGGARRLALTAAIAWAAVPGCGAEPRDTADGRHDTRRAEVRFPDGRLFVAEIADTPARVQRGYMFRREVKEDEGMVFVFPEPGFHSFWMKNTLVPLDIVWIDEEFTVIHIEPGVPPCKADPCATYGPLRKTRYVLEVRAGMTRAGGLKVGDRVRIAFPESAP